MITAFLAIVVSQLVLAALLFGTASLDRMDGTNFFARHPLVARHHRARRASARTLRRRSDELERLGVATRRAVERAA